MARKQYVLTAAILSAAISVGFGQDGINTGKAEAASPPAAAPDSASEGAGKPDRPGRKRPDPQQARKFLENLSPEQRAKMRENLQRWQKMKPEERKQLREREQVRKERMRREVEQAIKESGLQLDKDQRELYAMRYMQQRRKIEQALREEIEARRKPMVDEMVQQLKEEFTRAKPAPQTQPGNP